MLGLGLGGGCISSPPRNLTTNHAAPCILSNLLPRYVETQLDDLLVPVREFFGKFVRALEAIKARAKATADAEVSCFIVRGIVSVVVTSEA